MFNPNLKKKLIIVNIAQSLIDFCSIQPDIDETKIQAAELVAQSVDLKRLIGIANITRCIDPINLTTTPPQADIDLRELVIPAICFYTYATLLELHPATFTDAGYTFDKEASDRNVTTQAANKHKAVAEVFMEDVLEFLKKENDKDKSVKPENLTPGIRTFGGNEYRATN